MLHPRRPAGCGSRPCPLLHLVPNMLTILALCAGLTAIRYALDGRYELAVTLIGGRHRVGWPRRPLGAHAEPDQPSSAPSWTAWPTS